MERDEFLKSFGLGLALVCTGACFQACGGGGDDDTEPEPGGNGNRVNVNLNDRLLTVGSQYVTGNVLFIRLAAGNEASSFVATQAKCPHQGGNLNWRQADNRIQCDLHASQYTSGGAVLQQPSDGGTTSALKVYPVTVSGTTLSATVS
jgi:cytochrome b6-f complex iron-sulfur subunit